MKEALVAVHNAFHNCNGTDPYDGMPLLGEQLKPISGSDRLDINFTCKKHLRRMPTLEHLHQEPNAEFEILSRQAYIAKNEMTADEYLNHCKAVVSLSETTTSEKPRPQNKGFVFNQTSGSIEIMNRTGGYSSSL